MARSSWSSLSLPLIHVLTSGCLLSFYWIFCLKFWHFEICKHRNSILNFYLYKFQFPRFYIVQNHDFNNIAYSDSFYGLLHAECLVSCAYICICIYMILLICYIHLYSVVRFLADMSGRSPLYRKYALN